MMIMSPIYFDYMATTPIDPLVIEKMLPYMGPDGVYGNPASRSHLYGRDAAVAVDEARQKFANTIGANSEEICFTSGATEANNLAIFGAAQFYQRKGRHIVTLSTEHKSVLDCFQVLESKGFEVTYLSPQSDGLIDCEALEEAIRAETILVSVMHVNNEIGVIQPIQEIATLLQGKGIILHVDAAQSAGKLPIDVRALNVDLMSFSSHKNYGPKGIGALFVRHRPRIRLCPQIVGGGHEGGLRSGTLPTHQIVGMAEAFYLSESIREEEQNRLLQYRHCLWNAIKDIDGLQLNGHAIERVSGQLNFSLSGIDGGDLMAMMPELALSNTSACLAASSQPSYVLKAIGVSTALAQASVRLSMGRYTTENQVDTAISVIKRVANER